jgi:hypothetical protein
MHLQKTLHQSSTHTTDQKEKKVIWNNSLNYPKGNILGRASGQENFM